MLITWKLPFLFWCMTIDVATSLLTKEEYNLNGTNLVWGLFCLDYLGKVEFKISNSNCKIITSGSQNV